MPAHRPRRATRRLAPSRASGRIAAFALALALLALPLPRAAADDSHVAVGTRALSMGGAFSALADDASAPYWNPAGLTGLGHQAFLAEHSWLFGSAVGSDYVSFVLPLTWRQAVALDLQHVGLDEDGLRYGENRFGLSYAASLGRGVSIGATGRLVTRSFKLDETSLGEGSGFGLDWGVLWSPRSTLRLSLSTQDAFDTEIRYDDGRRAVAYRQALHAGASYRVRERVLLCGQVDDRWRAGMEVVPVTGLALRAGLDRFREDAEGTGFATGLGLKAGPLSVDYAFLQHPTLPATHSVQLSTAFNFNPPLVRLEDLRTRELYASLHGAYARDGVGDVRIRNLSDQPVAARLAVSVPGVSQSPTERDVVVRPRDAVDVSLPAVLSPARTMGLREDAPAQVVVSARYESARLPRTERISGRTVLFAPGAIDWRAGTAQAAAFVTPRDATVEDLSSFACRVPPPDGETPRRGDGFVTASLGSIARVLNALALLEVSYVQDPNTPYAGIAAAPRRVDTVRYPVQTLRRRSGDCDDTTVLLAALLESVGIATQLVDLPGHLMLVADGGLPDAQVHRLGVPDSLVVLRDGRVWIPLETTNLRGGFLQAWTEGARQLRRGEPGYVRVDTAWVRFPPASPPGSELVPMRPDSARLAERLRAEAASFRRMRDAFIGLLDERLKDDRAAVAVAPAGADAAAARLARRESQLGTALAAGGDLAAAESLFTAALAREPRGSAALTALGNVAWLRGDAAEARARYAAAIDADSTAVGARLNLALALLQEGRTAEAGEQVAAAVRLEGSARRLARRLGLPVPEDGRNGGPDPATMSAAEVGLLRLLGVPVDATRRQHPVPGDTPGAAAPASLLYWPPSTAGADGDRAP